MTESMPMDRSKGAIAMMATAVVQLGPAMIPACDSMSLLLISGTTSGTVGSRRNADD
jgi:hypothetical protein